MELLEKIKKIALDAGADVVGVASMDRFEGFPMQQDPRYMMPEAKSMIVLGHRTMRGSFRGAEEGTLLSHYPAAGRGYVTMDVVPFTVREVCRFIEDQGKEAMPIGAHFPWAATDEFGNIKKRYSVPVKEGLPQPDICFSMTHAAFLAGLGEIGYSGQLLNPEFGPRMVYGCVLTEMELPASPIMAPGTLCNRCMKCVSDCPGGCISKTETETLHLGGYDIEIGKFDLKKCAAACLGTEVTEDGSYKPTKYSPFKKAPHIVNSGFGIEDDICACRGCIRACMMELEDRKAISNLFDEPFQHHQPWEVNWESALKNPMPKAEPQVARNINDLEN